MTDADYSAAWVPDDDPERGWEEATRPVVDWILAEADRSRKRPLLVTPTQEQWHSGPQSITRFASHYDATTPRSKGVSRQRPVLVYVPDYDVMELAVNYARGSSLAVVETQSYPLIGWAVEVRALNLLTGAPPLDTRNAADLEAMNQIHFYGNNGWTTGFGKNQATRIIREMRDRGTLDRGFILGSMMARGHHGDAVKRLAKIIDSIV